MRSRRSRLETRYQDQAARATRLAYALTGDAERAQQVAATAFLRVYGGYGELRGADACERALRRAVVRGSGAVREPAVGALRRVEGLGEQETAATLRVTVRSVRAAERSGGRRLGDRLDELAGWAPAPAPFPDLALRVRRRRRRTLVGVTASLAAVAGLGLVLRTELSARPASLHPPLGVVVSDRPADLAYVDGHGGVSVLHPDGTRTRWVAPGALGGPRCGASWCGGFEGLAWSPDGTRLAMVHVRPDRHGLAHGVVYVATPGVPVPRALARCPGSSCDSVRPAAPAWSPDGTRLAVGTGGRIWVVPTSGRRFAPFAGCGGCGARSPAWSPDGRSLAYVTNGGILETDLRTGVTRRLSDQVPASVAWSPDGTGLLLAGLGLYVLDVEHPGALRAATAHEDEGGGVVDADWSPDGRQVVWLATPGGGTGNAARAEVGVAHVATRSSRVVVDHPCCVESWSAPRWSPDGARIAWVEPASAHPAPAPGST